MLYLGDLIKFEEIEEVLEKLTTKELKEEFDFYHEEMEVLYNEINTNFNFSALMEYSKTLIIKALIEKRFAELKSTFN